MIASGYRSFALVVGLNAIAGLFLSSCDLLREQTQKFAKNSASATTGVKSELQIVGNAEVAATQAMALNSQRTPFNRIRASAVTDAGLGSRLAVIGCVDNYTQGLSALVSAKGDEEIDAAAQSLGTSLGSLSKTGASFAGIEPISNGQVQLFSTVVAEIGKGVYRHQQDASTCEAIQETDALVQEAVTAVMPDLPKWGRIEVAYWEVASRNNYSHAQGATTGQPLGDPQRSQYVTLSIQQGKFADGAPQKTLTSQEALTNFAAAHHALCEAMVSLDEKKMAETKKLIAALGNSARKLEGCLQAYQNNQMPTVAFWVSAPSAETLSPGEQKVWQEVKALDDFLSSNSYWNQLRTADHESQAFLALEDISLKRDTVILGLAAFYAQDLQKNKRDFDTLAERLSNMADKVNEAQKNLDNTAENIRTLTHLTQALDGIGLSLRVFLT